jgi:hypothetical protein
MPLQARHNSHLCRRHVLGEKPVQNENSAISRHGAEAKAEYLEGRSDDAGASRALVSLGQAINRRSAS